jgi:hypothetical protein
MKFSLKTFLIVLCVGGAFVGLMGNLLLESPEAFLRVLFFCATVVPFVLAVGTVIALGLRLKKRKVVAWGILLLLVPPLTYGAMAVLMPRGNALALLTTRRLIERRLPKQVNEPWVWNELVVRLRAGNLSREQVDAAITELADYMKRTQPKGWDRPLSWQRDFLSSAIAAKLVSKEVLLDLCDAFFGAKPQVKPNVPPVSSGEQGFQLAIEYGNVWAQHSGLGVVLLWNVNDVRVDGKPVRLEQVNEFGEDWNANVRGKLSPGDHDVQIDVECAYVDALTGVTNDSKLPVKQWPKAEKRWKTTVTTPVKVVGEEEK